MPPSNSPGLFKRTIALFLPYWKSAAGVLVLTLISASVMSVEPLVQKYLFDLLAGQVQNPAPQTVAWSAIGAIAALVLLAEAMAFLAHNCTWRLRLRVNYRLLDLVVSHIYEMSLRYHQKETIASLRTRIDKAVNGFCSALFDISFTILPSLLYLLCTIFFMFTLSFKLTLVALLFAPLPAVFGFFGGRIAAAREKVLMDRWISIFSRFHETLTLIKTVKSFAMERRERSRFLLEVDAANGVVAKGVRIDSTFASLKNLSMAAGRLAVLGFGAYLIFHHQITIGTLVAFLSYTGGLTAPVIGLSGVYEAFKKARVYLGMLFDILDSPQEIADAPDAVELQACRGEIEFRDVVFGYQPERPVLRGVSFKIAAGSTVALVGRSGSGKTTVIDLLNRFYDAQSGAVLVDGTDVRAIKQASLHSQIGMVLQDTTLFNDTVRNNIAIAKPEASEAEVRVAAVAANADPFVQAKAEGYDTLVGERGTCLSGGERQRIGIARAVLKDAAILVFDEASSNLDSESEMLVQQAIERMRGQNTMVLIAHRLSTVKNADSIIVMDKGRVVEFGTHSELMARRGVYHQLVLLQSLKDE